MDISGKTALITGATGGMGYHLAKALASAGCSCACHYNKNREKCEKLIDELTAAGQKAIAIQADLTCPDQIIAMFEKAMDLAAPQILINSAGLFTREAITEVTDEVAQEVINTNLLAPILVSREFVKRLENKFPDAKPVVGKIINLSGVGGIRPWANYVLYCSTKAGLIGATKSLAKELAPKITVNSIAPGLVTWPENFSDEMKQKQIKMVPAKRTATLDEIADAMLFLLKNDYVTGHILNVDGGRAI
jgi:NAD(P)-dependent dehydrogenase (short-subunit alcohol dehydrogenase family)